MVPQHSRLVICLGLSALAAACLASRANGQVIISTNATQNMSCASGVCTPTAESAVLNVSDLENLLASGNVEINTTGSGVQANDIQVQAPFGWSAGNSLKFDAWHSILFAQAVTVSGAGGVSLVTNDGGSGGTLSFNSGGQLTFGATTNLLSINGQSYTLVANVPALAAAIAANPSGLFALSSNDDESQHGAYKDAAVPTTFQGSLNGLGNTISRLRIESPGENGPAKSIGLFSELDTGGSISSLLASNITIKVSQLSTSIDTVGALIGENFGTLFNDVTSGQISAGVKDLIDVGGIAGYNDGSVANTSSTVTFKLKASKRYAGEAYSGGLVGDNGGTIGASFSTGNMVMTGLSSGSAAGGLVATSGGQIENCFATGDVVFSGEAQIGIGGLAGFSFTGILDSYSTGAVSAKQGGYLGGFVGYDDSNGELGDNYWDTTTSGIKNPSQGAGNIANDPGIAGETNLELKSGLPAGFDPTIWAETPNINNGLPYLIANPPRK